MLELIWWFFTAAIVYLVMNPIINEAPQFPFILPNAIFIILFITLTRYIFLFKTTWLYKYSWVQVVLILLSVFIVAYLIRQLNNFTGYMENVGLMDMLDYLPFDRQKSLSGYIKTEYLLTGIGSIAAAVIFPFRLIVAIWQKINRKK